MDCQSIAATETNNIGSRSAADGAPARMMHAERRFPRRSSLLLGALPSAVPCARLHARQVLWEWGLSGIAETAELPLSELKNGFPELDAESGRGLFLVETLSERWGWYPTRNLGGKVIWCELGREDKRS